jgi:DNA repair protein RadC
MDDGPMYRLRLADLPEVERPRERFVQVGPSGASLRELLAILLRTGPSGASALSLADMLLARFGGLNGLARADPSELRAVKGIGHVRAIEIRAALELGRRMALSAPEARPQIKTPAEAAVLLQADMGFLEQEEVHTLSLDTRNRVITSTVIYRGSLNSASIRAGEVFKAAIRANAASIIVAHNHPSGDPSPSGDDVRVTQVLVEAGRLLDIDVLDHIIVGQGRFVSMKERGLGFG